MITLCHFFSLGDTLCSDCLLCHIISCKRVCVPFSASIIISVYSPGPATSCFDDLPSEYSFVGHETIPLVSEPSHNTLLVEGVACRKGPLKCGSLNAIH